MTELKDSLKTSSNTAVGADNISTEKLKHMPEHFLQTILLLLKKIWFAGELPMCWLHSIIVPLHKLNKPTNLPSSHRPISLTSHLCKLMERMVTVRLRWYLESNNLLKQYQSAFRERRRPFDHLLCLHDTVHKALAHQRSVLAVFLDIEKAYDLVYKDILLIKLLNLGVNGFMLNFIAAFLTNRSFQVRISLAHSQVLQNEL